MSSSTKVTSSISVGNVFNETDSDTDQKVVAIYPERDPPVVVCSTVLSTIRMKPMKNMLYHTLKKPFNRERNGSRKVTPTTPYKTFTK